MVECAKRLREEATMRCKTSNFGKILATIFASICLLPMLTALQCSKIQAYAEEAKYVRILDEGVCLFASEGSSKVLFTLEQTYYLEVVEETENSYCVAVMDGSVGYPQIIGYVFKNEVDSQTEVPALPHYPQVKIAVSENSATLRLSPTPSAQVVATALNTQRMSYYGSIFGYDKLWHYVWYCGKFGYVEASEVSAPQISPHPTPLPSKPTVNPVTPSEGKEPAGDDGNSAYVKTSPAAEIVMIVFVILLAVTLTTCAFFPFGKKQDGKNRRNVFDDDI